MKKIKILNHEYDLVDVDFISEIDDFITIGDTDYTTNTIRIKKGLPKSRATQAMWHEIVHGILDALGRIEENKNEDLVDCIATGICCVLADNDFLKK